MDRLPSSEPYSPPESEKTAKENSSWFKRNKLKALLGIAAVSATCSAVLDPLSETKAALAETAPWVGAGLIAGEVAWIGGATIMLTSVGKKIGNPLRVHQRFNELANHAKDSLLFKLGLTINSIGAIGQAGVASAGILELPPKSWGLLVLPLYDLSITVALRQALWQNIKKTADTPTH